MWVSLIFLVGNVKKKRSYNHSIFKFIKLRQKSKLITSHASLVGLLSPVIVLVFLNIFYFSFPRRGKRCGVRTLWPAHRQWPERPTVTVQRAAEKTAAMSLTEGLTVTHYLDWWHSSWPFWSSYRPLEHLPTLSSSPFSIAVRLCAPFRTGQLFFIYQAHTHCGPNMSSSGRVPPSQRIYVLIHKTYCVGPS